ncbi:hypothetical protein Pfo_009602 [Paulownia fortunei]|nr:hypothetical protein Pfo_009602 [Paulownia fortunei]
MVLLIIKHPLLIKCCDKERTLYLQRSDREILWYLIILKCTLHDATKVWGAWHTAKMCCNNCPILLSILSNGPSGGADILFHTVEELRELC